MFQLKGYTSLPHNKTNNYGHTPLNVVSEGMQAK